MKVRLTVALAAVAGAALLVLAPTAFGAQATKTLNFPLTGSSTTNIFSLGPEQCCEASVFGVDLGDIHDVTLSLDMGTALSSPTHSDLTFTDTNLRQGRTLDLTNTYTRDSGGKLDVNYTLAFHASIYGFVVDPSKTVGDSMDCSVPLLTQHCEHTTEIGLFDITVLDIGVGSAKVHFSVPITTKADISGNGVSSSRTMSVAGSPILGPDTLTFNSDPFVKNESTLLGCSLPANEPVNYAMDTASSAVDGTVTENVGLAVSLVGDPIVGDDFTVLGPFTIFSLDAFSKTINTINMSAPAQNVDLGNLLPNNIAPTAAMDTIPTDGQEGKPITLAVKGTGPGGSLSPCGDDGLDIVWQFDDGGTAFGKSINHSFPDNLLGEAPRSGHVTITDPTGLSKTIDFSVPVANVNPTVGAGPNKTALWGVPVAFHANGADQGPVDNTSLLYSWAFGDPASPIGAAGQDVSHTYAMPGVYTATVTVMDHDTGTGTSNVQVTIAKRGTTTAYTGPLKSLPSKQITLSATLVDELGQPVAGRTIAFQLGSQSASATTSASGVATVTIKLNQQKGSYPLSATFTEDGKYLGSANNGTFVIGN
jgi:PKD domain